MDQQKIVPFLQRRMRTVLTLQQLQDKCANLKLVDGNLRKENIEPVTRQQMRKAFRCPAVKRVVSVV